MHRVLVLGQVVEEALDIILKEKDEIITNGKVDIYDYCERRNLDLVELEASWDVYNSYAGFINNDELLDQSLDFIIVFWDKQHPGIKDVISKAHKLSTPIFIWYLK